MKELERLQTKQQKVQNEIRQLENRQKILLNRQSDAERRARTRRLIEHGANHPRSRGENALARISTITI